MTIEQAINSLKNGTGIIYESEVYDLLYIGSGCLVIEAHAEDPKTVPMVACEHVGSCLADFPLVVNVQGVDKFIIEDVLEWKEKYSDKLNKIERRV